MGEEEPTLSEGLPQLSGHPLHGLGRDLGAKVPVKRRRGSPLSDRLTVTTWALEWWIITTQTQEKGWTDMQ